MASTDAGEAPSVRVVIDGQDFSNVKEWSWISDVTTLGDDCTVLLDNADGWLSDRIAFGQSLDLYVTDPEVNGGAELHKLRGLVTKTEMTTDMAGGESMLVHGADLGWHLNNNCGELFLNLDNITYQHLLEAVIDPSWGFQGVRQGNDLNVSLRQGRAGKTRTIAKQNNYTALMPPIQFEPGSMIAPILIEYARRLGLLVNVSSDGWLQFFTPNYVQEAKQELHYHRADDEESSRNNVQAPIQIVNDIAGVYTHVTCVGSRVLAPSFTNTENFNEGKFRGEYDPSSTPLPFKRLLTFSDGEPSNKHFAALRAEWRWKREFFGSFQASYTVQGISQQGLAWDSDTMISINDTVHGVVGPHYVSQVHCAGRGGDNAGTSTTMRVHKPNLLTASAQQ